MAKKMLSKVNTDRKIISCRFSIDFGRWVLDIGWLLRQDRNIENAKIGIRKPNSVQSELL